MMDDLKKKLEAKYGKPKAKPGDDMKKQAKMNMLSELKGAASEAMGDQLKNLKKVTVAADSKEGLKEGIEKASEMLGHEEHEAEESPAEEAAEHMEDMDMEDCDTPEKVDAKIEMLMKMKKDMLAGKA